MAGAHIAWYVRNASLYVCKLSVEELHTWTATNKRWSPLGHLIKHTVDK